MPEADPLEPLPKAVVAAMAGGVSVASICIVFLVLQGSTPLLLLNLPLLGAIVGTPLFFRAKTRKEQRNNS